MSAHCDSCGRFFSWEQPGSSWLFVPDSYLTREELCDRCASCTAKHGPPISTQNVRMEMCGGTYPTAPTTDKEQHDG